MTTQTTSNLPALRGETAVAAPNEWADFAPDGTEDIAPSFPIIKIVAGTSQMTGASKHAGEFYRTDTEEFLPTIDVVPLFQKQTRAVFADGSDQPLCRSDDGKAPAGIQPLWRESSFRTANGQTHEVPEMTQPRTCATCPFGMWGANDEPPLCRESVVVLVDAGGGDLAQLRIQPSSIGVWRKWIGRVLNPKKLPLCSQRLALTTAERSKPGKKWYELIIDATQLSPAEAAMYNAVLQYEANNFERAVREADAAEVGGMVIDGDDIDELPFE